MSHYRRYVRSGNGQERFDRANDVAIARPEPVKEVVGTRYEDQSILIGYTEKGDQMRVGISHFQGKNYLGMRLYYWGGQAWLPGKQGMSLPAGPDWTLMGKAAQAIIELASQKK